MDRLLIEWMVNEDKYNIKYQYDKGYELDEDETKLVAKTYPYLSESMKKFVLKYFDISVTELLMAIDIL